MEVDVTHGEIIELQRTTSLELGVMVNSSRKRVIETEFRTTRYVFGL